LLTKLNILTFLPAIIITISFFLFTIHSYKDLQHLYRLQKSNYKVQTISTLINDLQQERGLSSGYIASKGTKFHRELQAKRVDVQHSFEKFLRECSRHRHDYKNKLKELQNLRSKIDRLSLKTEFTFDYYSKLIQEIQNDYLKLTLTMDDKSIDNILKSYTNLSFMKESLGQIRGTFNGILSKNTHNFKLHHRGIHAKGMYDASVFRFQAIAPTHFKEEFSTITKSPDYIFMQNVMKSLFVQNRFIPNVSADEWFINTTHIINKLYSLEQAHLEFIKKDIQKNIATLKIKLFVNIFLFVLFIFFTLWLSFRLKYDISKNLKLLSEYKNAVDRSSIVSKTDKKGIITYVNDKFCSISGYTTQELIGQKHNIVRHEDMPKSAFKHMWKTIMAKKPWFGIIKNKKKNGDFYIVEVTINPILDQHGNIEEFIAIRNDITNVIKLHEDLEHTQEDLIYRMGEIGETRSQETGYHVRRVAKYSELLAKYYGLSEKEIKYLTTASPMHDIGKVGIPDDILNKPGALTQNEWDIMKRHAEIGYELFKDSSKPLLQTAAIIAYEHHEKYDGSGYPRGLSGENIHIYGRITALADVFDALGSDRCYKKAWSDEKIFRLIKEEKGKHFDPKLVDIFFEHIDEFLEIRDKYNDSSSFMQEKKA
jgi:PAS domain S-box-containing protein